MARSLWLLGAIAAFAAAAPACNGMSYAASSVAPDADVDGSVDAPDATDGADDRADVATADVQDAGSDVIDLTGRKRIFVTSLTFSGNLGGLAGADAKCQTAADGVPLGGQYVAWLSLAGTDAIDRVPEVGPWYSQDRLSLLFTGRKTGAHPLSGTPAAPILLTEAGVMLPMNTFYWTGTALTGVASPQSCVGWTDGTGAVAGGNGGETGQTSVLWTFTNGNAACSTLARLLCIEK